MEEKIVSDRILSNLTLTHLVALRSCLVSREIYLEDTIPSVLLPELKYNYEKELSAIKDLLKQI